MTHKRTDWRQGNIGRKEAKVTKKIGLVMIAAVLLLLIVGVGTVARSEANTIHLPLVTKKASVGQWDWVFRSSARLDLADDESYDVTLLDASDLSGEPVHCKLVMTFIPLPGNTATEVSATARLMTGDDDIPPSRSHRLPLYLETQAIFRPYQRVRASLAIANRTPNSRLYGFLSMSLSKWNAGLPEEPVTDWPTFEWPEH